MKKMMALDGLMALVVSACASSSADRISDSELKQYQNLLAKEEVRSVVNRLFISTDNRDWDAVKAVFASEVLFDMTSTVGVGGFSSSVAIQGTEKTGFRNRAAPAPRIGVGLPQAAQAGTGSQKNRSIFGGRVDCFNQEFLSRAGNLTPAT